MQGKDDLMTKRKYLPLFVAKILVVWLISIVLAFLAKWLFSVWIALLVFTPIAFVVSLLLTVDWLKDTITVTDQYALVRNRTMGFFGEKIQRVYLNTITEPKTDKGFLGLIFKVGYVELQTASDIDVVRYGPIFKPNEVIEYIDEALRAQVEHATEPIRQGNRIILIPEDER